jgi:hypothetical protein
VTSRPEAHVREHVSGYEPSEELHDSGDMVEAMLADERSLDARLDGHIRQRRAELYARRRLGKVRRVDRRPRCSRLRSQARGAPKASQSRTGSR